MTSPVVEVMNQIATDWIAETPPTRTTSRYHEDTRPAAKRRGNTSADRAFWWDLPMRLAPVAEDGSAATQVDWIIRAHLLLSAAGRGFAALADAVANESNQLLRAVEQRTAWPAGVIEVITEDTQPDRDAESGDAEVVMTFRVLCSETD